jgi:exonuclease SbcC
MRLIKLKIKNIASLKGEHEIDFSQIQNQSPLFAITGETGAGKSSILNAIGMVLYGKVYKSNVTQNDLVTLGEKDGHIELIFQAQGKYYLALWRAKVRKQNGELYSTPQPAQREIYNLEGQNVDSPKTILTTRIEELLNLDFDQFCKCIILNQGEFAKFLSSSFTERKDILEKLYSGEMLESLSRELKSELDGLQKQKNDLDIELFALKGDGPQGDDLSLLKHKLEEDYKLHEDWLNVLDSLDYHFTSLHSYHKKFLDSQLKIETIKNTLSKETSIFNDFLSATQIAAESFLSVQKEQESSLPELQELLKSEEALRHTNEQKEQSTTARDEFQKQSDQLSLRQTQAAQKLSLWDLKYQEMTQGFSLPLVDLKSHFNSFESIFDLYAKKELLEQELKTKEERLKQLEVQGKEEAQELKEISSKKTSFEEDKRCLEILELKKKELSKAIEDKQRARHRLEEINLKLADIRIEITDFEKKALLHSNELHQFQQDHLPLQTTIKLQSLLIAVETCLTHPSLEENQACPVCKSPLSPASIKILRSQIEKTDFTLLKSKEIELSRLIMKKESDILQTKEKIVFFKQEEIQKSKEIEDLFRAVNKKTEDPEAVENELKESQKKVWEQEKLLKDEERINLALKKTREQYQALKNDLAQKSEIKSQIDDKLSSLTNSIMFLKNLNLDSVTLLKNESRKLTSLIEHEGQGDKLTQENNHLLESAKETKTNLLKIQGVLTSLDARILSLSTILETELKGKRASDLISELNQRVKEKAETLGVKERELKSQELKLKESQSRLYTLDELTKEIDLQFSKEIHELRLISKSSLPRITQELNTLIGKLGTLSLELNSSEALFIPLMELISSQKTFYKEKTSELKMSYASVRARLEDWEKRQDRITLLKLKAQDLIQKLDRRSRLYEVLGKDELRTFVLSLVEENLITQTNDELQKLCQGRYEIVHQSRRMKLTPEFYILDKFREGGLRKVSTLSGGETFMVSLAMALGLAEMTRGKAEIDTLFIDEGFGTLDQESLEDVLDMLKQIQTRGLMVGIISHVKALTDALPVNLQVIKKQDGTSNVAIVYN